jgi:hypothetical protein
MPRLRHDGAPKGAFGVLEAQLPSEQAAIVEERIRPSGPLSKQGFQLGRSTRNVALRAEDVGQRCTDPDLFDIFVRRKVYRRYAEMFLDKEQVDEVDESRIPGYQP